jgi:hypothetical protein
MTRNKFFEHSVDFKRNKGFIFEPMVMGTSSILEVIIHGLNDEKTEEHYCSVYIDYMEDWRQFWDTVKVCLQSENE